jgi:rod shape-determining protein MreC
MLLQTTLAPAQGGISALAQSVAHWAGQSSDVQALQTRNAELEDWVNKLMIENVQLRELEQENQRLRQLLNYTQSNPQFSYHPTAVIGHSIGADPTNLLYYVYIDVGARDGLAEDMPVVTDRGLVGRISAVGRNSAQVLLLLDPASSVNARVQNSRATGLVRGNIDGTLLMERIPPSEVVNPGDLVLTSGLGGNFPEKLVIGQVIEVVQRDQDMFQTAHLRPTVDFAKLEKMLIITSFEPVDFEAEILESQEPDD